VARGSGSMSHRASVRGTPRRSSPTPTETSSSFIRPDDFIANASLDVFGKVFGSLDRR
jgi:hypothetical protein